MLTEGGLDKTWTSRYVFKLINSAKVVRYGFALESARVHLVKVVLKLFG